MNAKLFLQALLKFLLGVVLVGLLVFLPAGSLSFFNGWLFLTMPLVLGSVIALLIFLAYPFIIAKRIRHEEDFLAQNLNGYAEYMQKVKYRLIPCVW